MEAIAGETKILRPTLLRGTVGVGLRLTTAEAAVLPKANGVDHPHY